MNLTGFLSKGLYGVMKSNKYDIVKGMYDYICERSNNEGSEIDLAQLTIPTPDSSVEYLELQFQEFEHIIRDKYSLKPPVGSKKTLRGLWTIFILVLSSLCTLGIILSIASPSIRTHGNQTYGLWIIGIIITIVLFGNLIGATVGLWDEIVKSSKSN